MKEMTRKEFLKLTGASTALLAMSHIIPTSAYADTSKIDKLEQMDMTTLQKFSGGK